MALSSIDLKSLVAASVASAAVLVAGLAIWGDTLRIWYLAILDNHLVQIVSSVVFSRLTVHGKNEGTVTTMVASAVLGPVAILSLNLRSAGNAHTLAPLYATQLLTYVFPLCHQEAGLVGSTLISLMASFAIFHSLENGLESYIFLFAVSLTLAWLASLGAWCVAQYFVDYRQVEQFRRIGGAFGCAAGAVYAEWLLKFLFPVNELSAAYKGVGGLVGAGVVEQSLEDLMLVAFNVQISLGFLGIAYLRRNQAVRNHLIDVGRGESSATQYFSGTLRFVMLAAAPYILQRTVMECMNSRVEGHFANTLDNAFRLGLVFDSPDALPVIATSNFTIDAYAGSLSAIWGKSYSLVERKLFSLPKIALLPSVIATQPLLAVTVLPVSIAVDALKEWLVQALKTRVQELNREAQTLRSRRDKGAQFDTSHVDLIQKAAAMEFTRARWRETSTKIQHLQMESYTLSQVRGFVNWLYWQDILSSGISCAIAQLLVSKTITLEDVWLFSRIFEDAIDMLLTRSRSEAELAELQTEIDKVVVLSESISNATRKLSAEVMNGVTIDENRKALQLFDVKYTRGHADISIERLTLNMGRIYAVTGANGAGKSTLFALIGAFAHGGKNLPAGMNVERAEGISLPSNEVIEVAQHSYCPLYVEPMSWILQIANISSLPAAEFERAQNRTLEFIDRLKVYGDVASGNKTGLLTKLNGEKEKWYDELSGGQRTKIELIRRVFLREECPKVLLIDEAFSPLDPVSKRLVQKELRSFCAKSLVLAIYHHDSTPVTDSITNAENGSLKTNQTTDELCISGNSFFDDNLRFANGKASLVGLCKGANDALE